MININIKIFAYRDNSDNPIDMGLFGTEVIYKMPQAEKKDYRPLEFPVWNISDDDIDYHEEGVDLWLMKRKMKL